MASSSILFRQTNIVWLALCAGTIILRRLAIVEPKHAAFTGSHGPLNTGTVGDVVSRAVSLVSLAWAHVDVVVDVVIPFAPTLITFAAFVFFNGGIVLGDRANHQVSFNLPQLFYFSAFATAFSFPLLLGPSAIVAFIKHAVHQLTSPLRFIKLAVLLSLAAGVVYKFT